MARKASGREGRVFLPMRAMLTVFTALIAMFTNLSPYLNKAQFPEVIALDVRARVSPASYAADKPAPCPYWVSTY